MLYFSKIKLLTIYLIILLLSFFAIGNFLSINENSIFFKKVKLGLDLQGGSYLLLEVDSTPIVTKNLQQKLLSLRKNLKSNNIKYQNLKLTNDSINFELNSNDIETFEEFFLDKDNPFNFFYGTGVGCWSNLTKCIFFRSAFAFNHY